MTSLQPWLDPKLQRTLRNFITANRNLAIPLGTFGFYFLWVWLFRLLILSFVTYFMLPDPAKIGSGLGQVLRFEEISEVLGANELPLIGVSAFLFVAFLRALYPLTSTTTQDIFTQKRFRVYFLSGASHGFVFAFGLGLAFLFSGIYRVFGFSILADEFVLALPGLILRTTTLIIFIYCEEYIFRRKIMPKLISPKVAEAHSIPWVAIISVSVLYCLAKWVQFDLGIMQSMTLFLVSVVLSLQTLADGDFNRGAGFWAVTLVVFQPLFGFPVFGSEFSGILLLKYQATATAIGDLTNSNISTLQFLTGGFGGPLSSFAFQFLLVLEIIRTLIKVKKHKKTLLQPLTNR